MACVHVRKQIFLLCLVGLLGSFCERAGLAGRVRKHLTCVLTRVKISAVIYDRYICMYIPDRRKYKELAVEDLY